MNRTVKTIISGIFLTAAAVVIFFSLRIDSFENEYTSIIMRSSDKLTLEISEIIKLDRNDLSSFAGTALNTFSKGGRLALAVITNENYAIQKIWRNDSIARTKDQFDAIINDFIEKKIVLHGDNRFIVRYYRVNDGAASTQVKYYLFPGNTGGMRTLFAYVYSPDRRMILMFGLELLLVFIAGMVITLLVYISMKRKEGPREEPVTDYVDLNAGGRLLEKEEKTVRVSEVRPRGPLDDYLYELFSNLKKVFQAEKLSLYVYTDNALVKSHELKGNSFLKIDSENFDVMSMDPETGNEMKKNSHMLFDKGRKVLFPVIRNESFLGAVSAVRDDEFSAEEIGEIMTGLAGLPEFINEYIVVNDIMTDRKTGLYSRTFFNLKYNEYCSLHSKYGNRFSLLLVSLTHNVVTIGQQELVRLTRFTAPLIAEQCGSSDIMFVLDGMIGVLMPDVESGDAVRTAENIIGDLSRYRVKINPDTTIILTPYIGVSATDIAEKAGDIYRSALSNLDYSMSSEQSGVQSMRIKAR